MMCVLTVPVQIKFTDSLLESSHSSNSSFMITAQQRLPCGKIGTENFATEFDH